MHAWSTCRERLCGCGDRDAPASSPGRAARRAVTTAAGRAQRAGHASVHWKPVSCSANEIARFTLKKGRRPHACRSRVRAPVARPPAQSRLALSTGVGEVTRGEEPSGHREPAWSHAGSAGTQSLRPAPRARPGTCSLARDETAALRPRPPRPLGESFPHVAEATLNDSCTPTFRRPDCAGKGKSSVKASSVAST